MNISIHALLAESDVSIERCNLKEFIFLSTLSLRRATCQGNKFRQGRSISIHALLAESDADTTGAETSHENFYPRSPCGERQRT